MQYFWDRGHRDITVFVPQWRFSKDSKVRGKLRLAIRVLGETVSASRRTLLCILFCRESLPAEAVLAESAFPDALTSHGWQEDFFL